MHSKIGEFTLIERIKVLFAPLNPPGVLGIGDDCAVIKNGSRCTVITTDMLCQDIHFTIDMGGYAIGRRAVMANLSDIAAMGASVSSIFLSISVPRDVDEVFLGDFFAGVRSCDVALLGGDTTSSASGFVVNITAIGNVSSSHLKLRSGAKVGDIILTAGVLGGASASNFKAPIDAQTEQGIWFGGRSEVHSMMDISDGLAGDLPHILSASGVGATVEIADIPIANMATLEQALGGGEDFVLLLTCDGLGVKRLMDDYFAHFGSVLYPIGRIISGASTILYTHNGNPTNLSVKGYTHF